MTKKKLPPGVLGCPVIRDVPHYLVHGPAWHLWLIPEYIEGPATVDAYSLATGEKVGGTWDLQEVQAYEAVGKGCWYRVTKGMEHQGMPQREVPRKEHKIGDRIVLQGKAYLVEKRDLVSDQWVLRRDSIHPLATWSTP